MLNDNFTATERNALEGEGWGWEVEVGVNNHVFISHNYGFRSPYKYLGSRSRSEEP